MPLLEYRAYEIDDASDRILQRIDLVCDGDAAAKERAQQLVDRHPIVLGRGAELLGRFEPKH